MLTKEQLITKEKYILRNPEGEIVEKFRYMDTIHNNIHRLEKLYGKLNVERIENAK